MFTNIFMDFLRINNIIIVQFIFNCYVVQRFILFALLYNVVFAADVVVVVAAAAAAAVVVVVYFLIGLSCVSWR